MKRRTDEIGVCLRALKSLADYFASEQTALKNDFESLMALTGRKPETSSSESVLVAGLLSKSKFDFSKADFRIFRNPAADREDTIAFDVVLFRETPETRFGNASVSTTAMEKRTFHTYSDMAKSVREFDVAVSSMSLCPPFKAGASFNGTIAPIPQCRCKAVRKRERKADRKEPLRMKKAGDVRPPSIESLKRELLAQSQYKVPYHRLRIVADKDDRKSRKWVYELRFFQRDCTHHKDQPYEPVPFRIRMDRVIDAKLAGKRFDKAVEGLRFNKFEKK